MGEYFINRNNKLVVKWNLGIQTASLNREFMSWT